jgi:hypothetical protein
MKPHVVASVCSLALLSLIMLTPASAQPSTQQTAQQSRMKSCADEWNAMKAANQTAGKTYRAFQKECLARTAATPAAPTATPPASPAPAPAAKAAGGGRQAMLARERACGAEWKSAKAAGTVAAGMKWPQYWSECNKRKKAEGM